MDAADARWLYVRPQQELKAIDESLAKYHKTKSSIEKGVLTAALLKWMQLKGPAWKQSVPNKHQAVEILYSQITGLADRHLNGREMVRCRIFETSREPSCTISSSIRG